ncbi:hypothetical protein RRG08_024716 [Elysia crispata]|uniref:Uncharacterized protein n=1 Tax=Elysia crispata TaxID=231223 RepID=A0AAE0YDX6_9GAST|nr:hypothetical protein RRG08_024716 [Elysia crispata]
MFNGCQLRFQEAAVVSAHLPTATLDSITAGQQKVGSLVSSANFPLQPPGKMVPAPVSSAVKPGGTDRAGDDYWPRMSPGVLDTMVALVIILCWGAELARLILR